MSTVHNPKCIDGLEKLVYCCRNTVVTHCPDLMPGRPELEGKYVLVHEIYVHDDWHWSKSSLIIGINGKDIETRNSIYRVVDDSTITNPFENVGV